MPSLLILLNKYIFDVLDIAIVSYVFYRVILLIRGTRAVQLLKGLIVLFVALGLSRVFHLQALNWLLTQTLTVGLFAIPVVFQPELRRGLEQLGRASLFQLRLNWQGTGDTAHVVQELVAATRVFSKNRIGALLVLERNTGLNEYVQTGIAIQGLLSAELLINTFIPNTPLHDGAAILRGERVLAASCFLPLSDSDAILKELGTRHRAGIGVTEQSDAVAIIVSEETGQISISEGGILRRGLDERELTERLNEVYGTMRNQRPFRLFARKGERA
ncbi:diadenylate cyclase CdaA [Ferroacidibacillus organovorans]|uniref:Diadenylate cyclase n=1 Tax=Ferroacidibacillus organovorans TaxID=1765683 RepID=A0A101XPN4_9BACL|nr:diadenylate cyclase CdaA [Ferroacidibacillus organovorans]KUO95139.1 hypothetical protein ATW55_13370 [Ferroacidibacillus organovorans]